MIRAPRALRTRLLAALALVLFTAWSGWFALQYVQMSKRQVGDIDGMIRNVAEQILQSLPEDIAAAGRRSRQFELEIEAEAPKAQGKFDLLAFQAWDLSSRRRLVSSRAAPAQALAPDFADGFTSQSIAGVPWRVFSVRDARGSVQLQVGIPEAAVHVEMRRWLRASFGTAVGLLLAFGVAVWMVIEWSLRPVARLGDALAARAPLDFAPLPDAGLPAEVAPLVQGFNRLLARLAQALQHEREFLGEAAHELRTPLAALLAQAQVLQHAGDRDEARIALDELIAGIERSARLAQQLLDAARVEAGGGTRATDLDLALVAGMVADEFAQVAARDGGTLQVDLRHTPVRGDIDDLGILVRNLLDNAVRHGGPGARVRLSTAVVVADAGARVIALRVEDDGPGIAEADRDRVFERFYRAGDGRRASGIGMGLSLVQRVVAAHGGLVHCGVGIDGRGCGIEVRLPLRQ